MRVIHGGLVVADTRRAIRVLETSHPPAFYLPMDDVAAEHLVPTRGSSACEWKGRAAYFDVAAGERPAPRAAWHYPRPSPPFAAILDHVAFFPGRVDACYVDDERVRAQDGDFYGGWITGEIVGPFKGGAGTRGW